MSDQSIEISKHFSVSASALYKAWTEESALKEWWKPMGKTLAHLENDIQEGGKVEYVFEDLDNPAGKLMIQGVYQTVVPEKKLVYTWNWILNDVAVENANYTLTVEFSEQDGETELNIKQQREKELEGVQPHKEGWEDGLESLKQYLETLS
ncbi:MAG: SRPBCC domain-containing protein [Pedobacter sp.]